MDNVELLIKIEHRLGESMLWHAARRCLYWLDLYDPMLCSFDPATGLTTQRVLDLAMPIGAIVETADPDVLLISHRGGLSTLHIDSLALSGFANPENGRSDVIANDMKVDRWGRLWFGTSHEREILPRGALWCVTDAKRWNLADVGFAISNGPAFSPDGLEMYFSDSFNRQILAYNISRADGQVHGRRVFASFDDEEGLPDGLTVDAEGCVWSAQWAGASVFRLSPKGEKLRRIAIPSGHVTSVAIHQQTLFLTTARDGLSTETLTQYPLSGSVFSVDVGVDGITELPFRI